LPVVNYGLLVVVISALPSFLWSRIKRYLIIRPKLFAHFDGSEEK